MRHLLSYAVIAAAIIGTPALAQTKPAAPTAASGVCASLMKNYDGASMDLASNYASSVGDNSAPRATLRAMEDANTLTEARIALDLMRDNRCPLPKTVPSYIWYISPALSCATDRLKSPGAQSPASCDRATWTRAEGKQ